MEKTNDKTKCPNCGYTLAYNPKDKMLHCAACNNKYPIDSKGGTLESKELSFDQVLKNLGSRQKDIPIMKCNECGASIQIGNQNTVSLTCPYCGSNKCIKENVHSSYIEVAGLIPFTFDEAEALNTFNEWMSHRKYLPRAFKTHKLAPTFYPIYIPYYTFDANTVTNYTGARGDDYTVSVTVRDSDGNTHTEQETRTDWTNVSGRVSRNFDDVFVIASKDDSSNTHIRRISNFNLHRDGIEFNPDFLLGYYAQTADIPPTQGFLEAKVKMENRIDSDIRRDIGGDHQRSYTANTKYSNVTCKQVMLPIYNGIYTYNGKKYIFALNGQTKAIYADRPYSGWKIFLTIFIIVLVITLVTVGIVTASMD